MSSITAVVATGNASSIDTYRCATSLKSQGAKVVVLVPNRFSPRTVMDSSVDVVDDAGLRELAAASPDGLFLLCSTQSSRSDIVSVVERAAKESPGAVVSFAGMTIYGARNGRVGQTCTVAKYCRLFGKQRFAENDSGPVEVDVVTSLPVAAKGSVVAGLQQPSVLLKDLSALSVAFAEAGVTVVVAETPDSWRSRTVSTYPNVQQYHFIQRTEDAIVKFGGWRPRELPAKRSRTPAERRAPEPEPVVEEPPKRAEIDETAPLPPLAVVFQTHNRTAMAAYVLESFVKNLKYGGRIRYIVADDRSYPGHVEALEDVFVANGVTDYEICRTNKTRWGLGSSLNNGLQAAFRVTDVVLTTEDDWWCKARFDITRYVRAVMQPDVAGVRFGSMNGRFNVLRQSPYAGLRHVTGSKDVVPEHRYVFNAQIMLRNKRAYDAVGLYRENVDIDTVECDMNNRFNRMFSDGNDASMMVLWPSYLKLNSLDSGFFMHIGKSTAGHGYDTPRELQYLNDTALEANIRKEALKKRGFFKSAAGENDAPAAVLAKVDRTMERDAAARREIEEGRPFFRIVIPAYNVEDYIERCIRSIAAQTFSDFVVSVCDDMSTDRTVERLEALREEFPWLVVTKAERKVWNGGARNMALDAVDGEYTVYIDADDYFADGNVLQALYETICASGGIDAVRMPYVERFDGRPDRIVRVDGETPEALANSQYPMPWLTCVRSSKVVRFPDDINAQVDVVHNLWQADNIDDIVMLDRPAVVYTDSNPNSVAHRAGRNRCHSSWFRAAAHILDTKYSHAWMKQAKKHVFNLWFKRLEREKTSVFDSIW